MTQVLTRDTIRQLPFQQMPGNGNLQVLCAWQAATAESSLPHRHDFFMLHWTLEGEGEQLVNFRRYEMCPGRVFFLHEGHIHQIIRQPRQARLILFSKQLFLNFLKNNPQQEQNGLFDYFSNRPYADLDNRTAENFCRIADLTAQEVCVTEEPTVIGHYLSILLLYANNLYGQEKTIRIKAEDAELFRRLRLLIEQNYRQKRDSNWYSEQLGIPAKRLNALSLLMYGKKVSELAAERLQYEIEAILATSSKNLKEIAYELGFADQSHFGEFFRKTMGLSPTLYRENIGWTGNL